MSTFSHLGTVIFALLGCNTIYYIVAGRFSEALESVAWYVLLILFVVETTQQRPSTVRWVLAANRGARLLATLAIGMTAVLYVREREWLDAANLFLWIAVVALLEIEVWRPDLVTTHRRAFIIAAGALYTALGVLVFVWLAFGKWMNAWDATLWLAAFSLLELQVLHLGEKLSFKNK